MNLHETIIHGKCPINGSWDYYNMTLETPDFIKCEDVDEIANLFRGEHKTQESIFDELFYHFAEKLCDFKLTLTGHHGQNNKLSVSKEHHLVTEEERINGS